MRNIALHLQSIPGVPTMHVHCDMVYLRDGAGWRRVSGSLGLRVVHGARLGDSHYISANSIVCLTLNGQNGTCNKVGLAAFRFYPNCLEGDEQEARFWACSWDWPPQRPHRCGKN